MSRSRRILYCFAVLFVFGAGKPSHSIELGKAGCLTRPFRGSPFEYAFRKVTEALDARSSMSLGALIEECEGFIDAQRALGRGEQPNELQELSRREMRMFELDGWWGCGAAIRQIGATGEEGHLQQLRQICGNVGMANVYVRQFQMSVFLYWECKDAVIENKYGEMGVEEFLDAWRQGMWTTEGRVEGLERSSLSTAFRRLVRSPLNQEPEILDKVMELLMDSEGIVRRSVRSSLRVGGSGNEAIIHASLRFLAREEIDENAREEATGLLRELGFEVICGERELKAVPLEADRGSAGRVVANGISKGFRVETKADGRLMVVPPHDDDQPMSVPKE